jgi:hypothetical protein
MGSNAFTKEEKVLFAGQVVVAEDALDMAGLIAVKKMDTQDAQRSGDTVWIPRPQIQTSYDGLDQSANFAGKVQLSVPMRVNNMKSALFELDALELRDKLADKSLFQASMEKLASDINLSIISTINRWGSLFIPKTGVATGFADLADVATLLDQNGVKAADRSIVLNPADYRDMADDLSKASRSLIGDISVKALRQAFVGELAGIQTYRQQYTKNQAAAAGGAGLTMSTLFAGGNVWTPISTLDSADGTQNVDSRRQQVALSSNTGVSVGDRFTLADCFNIHPITKESTGSLKTYVVVDTVAGSATDVVISPPFISALSPGEGGRQYQNVADGSPAANTALVFLNVDAAPQNYFFHKDAIALTPSMIAMPEDAGMAKMTATLSNGIQLVALKQGLIGPAKVQYRLTARWGVTVLAPEMVGSLAFNQVP